VTLRRIDHGPVTFSMTHRGHYASQPAINVEIASVTTGGVFLGTVRTPLVVDSGADCTILDEAYALPLGIDLSQCRIGQIAGIEGGNVPVRSARVLMYLCETWINAEVWFQANRRPQVLGRQDVFDNLFITFFHRVSELYASTA
jgi:hypothetical protein